MEDMSPISVYQETAASVLSHIPAKELIEFIKLISVSVQM